MMGSDLEPLVMAARRLAAAAWYDSPAGRSHMAEKNYVAGSVHLSTIVDALHDAAETEGTDPLRLLRTVLLVYSAEQDGENTRGILAEMIGIIDRHVPDSRHGGKGP